LAEKDGFFPKQKVLEGAVKPIMVNRCLALRSTLQEERLKDSFEGDDGAMIENTVQVTLDWLFMSLSAEKDELDAKKKELEGGLNYCFPMRNTLQEEKLDETRDWPLNPVGGKRRLRC